MGLLPGLWLGRAAGPPCSQLWLLCVPWAASPAAACLPVSPPLLLALTLAPSGLALHRPAPSFRHPNIVWVYGIVLPTLPDKPLRGSSAGSEPSSPGASGSGTGALAEAAGEPAPGGGEGGEGGGGGRRGRGLGDVVDAIASGMQRSGMQPGMVRPPALVTGARCAALVTRQGH